MKTVNDLELNENLTRAAQLLPIVSEFVRQRQLRSAAEKASDLVAVVRNLDWRIQELLTKEQK